MELVKYRDAGLSSYTWFWVDSNQKIVSPFFNDDEEARNWMNQKLKEPRDQDEQ